MSLVQHVPGGAKVAAALGISASLGVTYAAYNEAAAESAPHSPWNAGSDSRESLDRKRAELDRVRAANQEAASGIMMFAGGAVALGGGLELFHTGVNKRLPMRADLAVAGATALAFGIGVLVVGAKIGD